MQRKTGIIIFSVLWVFVIPTIFASKSDSYYGVKPYGEKFLEAVAVVLDHEGGYVDDPTDKGGETKYGISKRSYPSLNIAELTKEDAEAIYHRDFWEAQPYKQINDIQIVTKLFDLSINVGSKTANKIMQRALRATGHRVNEDGVLGSQTLIAINSADASDLLAALKSETAGYYRAIAEAHPKQEKFLKGWLNRAYS